jgi:hypothetical protein
MKISLIVAEDKFRRWDVVVSFFNDENKEEKLLLDAIRRNGIRVGFHIFTENVELDPVDFMMVNPKEIDEEIIILAGESFDLNFCAFVEEKAKGLFGLCFDNEVYKVELNKVYKCYFSWGGVSSNVIEWVIR